jgi:hypothetical protein
MQKKIYLLILIVLTMIISQSCCNTLLRTLSVGAGVQGSSIGPESTSYKPAIGAQAGVVIPVFCFCDLWSLRAGLNGSLQGANYEDDYGNGLIKGKVSMFYLNLPLVLRYQSENGFYGEAGLQPAFLLSAKDKFDGGSYDYKDFINTFDLGVPLEAGYEFKNNLGVGVRVTPGITNINSSDYEGSNKDRNFVVAFKATYSFKF